MEVKVYCLENCQDLEFETTDKIEGDMIISSAPKEDLHKLPSDSFVYLRWVKMNCTLGVYGECEYKGVIACVEGPFVQVSRIVDKRESVL